jgi:hypothetical protein
MHAEFELAKNLDFVKNSKYYDSKTGGSGLKMAEIPLELRPGCLNYFFIALENFKILR